MNNVLIFRKKLQILNTCSIVLYAKDIKHQDHIIVENVRFNVQGIY